MGYDIYSSASDHVQAEKFARKYGYAYLFKDIGLEAEQLTGEQAMPIIPDNAVFDGGPEVYFRANIWGMQEVRQYFRDLFNQMPEHTREEHFKLFDSFIEAISWNEGRHVTMYDTLKMLWVIQSFGQDVGQSKLVEEFIEFMEISSTLGGFRVW
jgi:hypothetical protein